VDETMREALVKQPKLEVLRQLAKKSGHRGLQEEGILLVAQGTTSLTELQRVMKL
jgi:type II secretory ATPase GspE/PulE/Tfp pilus assembly ATPase PilB-like protein